MGRTILAHALMFLISTAWGDYPAQISSNDRSLTPQVVRDVLSYFGYNSIPIPMPEAPPQYPKSTPPSSAKKDGIDDRKLYSTHLTSREHRRLQKMFYSRLDGPPIGDEYRHFDPRLGSRAVLTRELYQHVRCFGPLDFKLMCYSNQYAEPVPLNVKYYKRKETKQVPGPLGFQLTFNGEKVTRVYNNRVGNSSEGAYGGGNMVRRNGNKLISYFSVPANPKRSPVFFFCEQVAGPRYPFGCNQLIPNRPTYPRRQRIYFPQHRYRPCHFGENCAH